MGLVIEELRPLYAEMRHQNVSRVRFDYQHGRVSFDVFFFIDEEPFTLLFGARGHNVAFEIAVRSRFEADTRIPSDEYKALCDALGLHYDPANPFSPRAFLQDFSRQLPPVLPPHPEARPEDVARYRRDVERGEGFYFCGWRDNTVRSEHVTDRNLHKTRRLLGEKAHQICKRKNLSSCWSDNPDDPRVKRYARGNYIPE